ncbi:MAG: ThiF family adenylyltransferase [Thermoplasmatota archaeon]
MGDVRYSRQLLLPELGGEGQRRLAAARVLLVGAGGTGGAVAELLVRAGVGGLTIVDRDAVEESNLHRQLIYEEKDIGAPKAYIAAERLRAVNGDVRVEGLAEDFSPANALGLVGAADIVMDGTDNLETRYLINDACVKLGRPWVYVGAVGTYGMLALFDASGGPCFRCFLPIMPPPGSVPTCATAGVLNTIPTVMGALAATAAIKRIVGAEVSRKLLVYDAWTGEAHEVQIEKRAECPCCGRGRFDFLELPVRTGAAVLCGSDSVQITPAAPAFLDLERMASDLRRVGEVELGPLWLVLRVGAHRMTVFKNGRALVTGTGDEKTARALYSKYVGN